MIAAFLNPIGLLDADDDAPSSRLADLLPLLAGAELIPVTGLDEAELLRVPAAFTSWQVLLHGAVILRGDGEEDPAWRRLSLETQTLRAEALRLAQQAALHINQLSQLGLKVEEVQRHGHPLMVRLRHPHGLDLALDQGAALWQEWLDEGPFRGQLRLARQTGEVTLLPVEITPESAVNYVLGTLSPALSLGISAQPGDAGFLALCDFAVVPGSSRLLEPAGGHAEEVGDSGEDGW